MCKTTSIAKRSRAREPAAWPHSMRSVILKASKVTNLADLGAFAKTLKAEAEQRERDRIETERRAREAAAEADVFRRSIGEVAPLAVPPRAPKKRDTPPPLPLK